jgi:hypothetical protein
MNRCPSFWKWQLWRPLKRERDRFSFSGDQQDTPADVAILVDIQGAGKGFSDSILTMRGILCISLFSFLLIQPTFAQGGIPNFEGRGVAGVPLFGELRDSLSCPGIDFDGDGLDDYVRFDHGDSLLTIYTSQGEEFQLTGFSQSWYGSGIGLIYPLFHSCPDVEGDGLPNLIMVARSLQSNYPTAILLNIDFPAKTVNETPLGESGEWMLVSRLAKGNSSNNSVTDFDNDGAQDLILEVPGIEEWKIIRMLDGITISTISIPAFNQPSFAIPDLTGDGLPEMTDGYQVADISSGQAILLTPFPGFCSGALGDLTGDGFPEFLLEDQSGAIAYDYITDTEIWSKLGVADQYSLTTLGSGGERWQLLETGVIVQSGLDFIRTFTLRDSKSGSIIGSVPLADAVSGLLKVVPPPNPAQINHPFYGLSYSTGRVSGAYQLTYEDLPGMVAIESSISVSQGGILLYELDFGADFSGKNYRVLISTARAPSFFLGGLEIPLALTDMLIASYFDIYPTDLHQGMSGAFSVSGKSTASLGALSNTIPISAVGMTLFLAAIASENGGVYSASSVAVELNVIQ